MLQQIKAKTINAEKFGNDEFIAQYNLILEHFKNSVFLSEFNNDKYTVLPGFCDVHVHFREPGFSYKETVLSGSRAAAHGGFTSVLTMPNLNPVPDSYENIKVQKDIIDKDAVINVYPYGSITVGQQGEKLSDMEEMRDIAVAFSDDGKGVQTEELMREAMLKAKALGKIIVAHCEDSSLLFGGYIHKGSYAESHSHKGICSESEWKPIERDLKLAKETGCKYHVCHISTKESVSLIRKAKDEGVDVTCETAPHYLVLDDSDLLEDGRFKMNPPLRSKEDREALIEGIKDGTIDMIATDHAPHSKEEKSKGLEKSAFGIVGIETSFQIMYTKLVKKGIIDFERLIELMVLSPRKRFSIPLNIDYSIWDLEKEIAVTEDFLISQGKATPFLSEKLSGECQITVCNGKKVY
ncbi:MAG: dihydroorotase [Acutalibacteraceae bacterium]